MVKEEGTLDQMARRLEAGVATTNNTALSGTGQIRFLQLLFVLTIIPS